MGYADKLCLVYASKYAITGVSYEMGVWYVS